MKPEELIEILSERPFVPVRIFLSNGRTHDIRHPEMAIIGEEVMALGVARDDSPWPRIRFVSIPHITEVAQVHEVVGSDS
jgi:hypothetical protein